MLILPKTFFEVRPINHLKTIYWTHRHLNLPYHSLQHMAVCGLSLHLGSSGSHKTLEEKFIFQIGTLNLHGINERFSFN